MNHTVPLNLVMRVPAKSQAGRLRVALRGHQSDVVHFTLAMAVLVGGLWGMFVGIKHAHENYLSGLAAEKAAAFAYSRQQAAAYRNGSIFNVGDDGDCDKIRFDNRTGDFLSIEPVDCKEWWRQRTDELQRGGDRNVASAADGMRGLLESFKK